MQVPEVGTTVTTGQSFSEVESTKSVSDIYAPVTGEIVEVNGALDDAPEHVNTDPYGEGWMFEVRVADPTAIDGLLTAEQYRAQLG